MAQPAAHEDRHEDGREHERPDDPPRRPPPGLALHEAEGEQAEDRGHQADPEEVERPGDDVARATPAGPGAPRAAPRGRRGR